MKKTLNQSLKKPFLSVDALALINNFKFSFVGCVFSSKETEVQTNKEKQQIRAEAC